MNPNAFTHTENKYGAKSIHTSAGQNVREAGLIELLIALIERILAFLFSDNIKIITKSVMTLVCVFGFIALGGGVSAGTVTAPIAITVGVIMSVIEILCLKE